MCRSAQLVDIDESTVFGTHGSSSRGLRDPPREFPLYIVCRVPHSAVKHAQSSICSSACKPALYSPKTALYSNICSCKPQDSSYSRSSFPTQKWGLYLIQITK